MSGKLPAQRRCRLDAENCFWHVCVCACLHGALNSSRAEVNNTLRVATLNAQDGDDGFTSSRDRQQEEM